MYKCIKEHAPRSVRKKAGQQYSNGIIVTGYFNKQYCCWCPLCGCEFFSVAPSEVGYCSKHKSKKKTQNPKISVSHVQNTTGVNYQDLKPLFRREKIEVKKSDLGFSYIYLTELEQLTNENKNS